MFAEAGCALAATRLALSMFKLPTVARLVRRALRADSPLAEARRRPEREVIRSVESAAYHSPAVSTCLATALVAQALLSRHAYKAQLRIGVRRDHGGPFAAHAWLERDGQVIVGGPAGVVESYTPLPDLEHLMV